MILCVCNCFLLYNYFLITIFLSKSAFCSHFLLVSVKGEAKGAPGMDPNMSQSRKKLSNIHSNKFHKLTICNCVHMFMCSWYRIAMGIGEKELQVICSFLNSILDLPLQGNFFKNSLNASEHF